MLLRLTCERAQGSKRCSVRSPRDDTVQHSLIDGTSAPTLPQHLADVQAVQNHFERLVRLSSLMHGSLPRGVAPFIAAECPAPPRRMTMPSRFDRSL